MSELAEPDGKCACCGADGKLWHGACYPCNEADCEPMPDTGVWARGELCPASDHMLAATALRLAARDALDVIECLRRAFPSTVGLLAITDTCDELRRKLEVGAEVVHVLHQGATLCELRAEPNTWPKNERWVSMTDSATATCPRCRSMRVQGG